MATGKYMRELEAPPDLTSTSIMAVSEGTETNSYKVTLQDVNDLFVLQEVTYKCDEWIDSVGTITPSAAASHFTCSSVIDFGMLHVGDIVKPIGKGPIFVVDLTSGPPTFKGTPQAEDYWEATDAVSFKWGRPYIVGKSHDGLVTAFISQEGVFFNGPIRTEGNLIATGSEWSELTFAHFSGDVIIDGALLVSGTKIQLAAEICCGTSLKFAKINAIGELRSELFQFCRVEIVPPSASIDLSVRNLNVTGHATVGEYVTVVDYLSVPTINVDNIDCTGVVDANSLVVATDIGTDNLIAADTVQADIGIFNNLNVTTITLDHIACIDVTASDFISCDTLVTSTSVTTPSMFATYTESTNIIATGQIEAANGSITGKTIISLETISAGTDIISTGGDINSTIGSVSAFTTITGGTGVIATTGDITADSGSVNALEDITAGGNVISSNSVSAGTTVVATNDILSTTGSLRSSVGDIIASAGNVNCLEVNANSVNTVDVSATGTIAGVDLTASNSISSSGSVLIGDGLTIATGDVVANDSLLRIKNILVNNSVTCYDLYVDNDGAFSGKITATGDITTTAGVVVCPEINCSGTVTCNTLSTSVLQIITIYCSFLDASTFITAPLIVCDELEVEYVTISQDLNCKRLFATTDVSAPIINVSNVLNVKTVSCSNVLNVKTVSCSSKITSVDITCTGELNCNEFTADWLSCARLNVDIHLSAFEATVGKMWFTNLAGTPADSSSMSVGNISVRNLSASVLEVANSITCGGDIVSTAGSISCTGDITAIHDVYCNTLRSKSVIASEQIYTPSLNIDSLYVDGDIECTGDITGQWVQGGTVSAHYMVCTELVADEISFTDLVVDGTSVLKQAVTCEDTLEVVNTVTVGTTIYAQFANISGQAVINELRVTGAVIDASFSAGAVFNGTVYAESFVETSSLKSSANPQTTIQPKVLTLGESIDFVSLNSEIRIGIDGKCLAIELESEHNDLMVGSVIKINEVMHTVTHKTKWVNKYQTSLEIDGASDVTKGIKTASHLAPFFRIKHKDETIYYMNLLNLPNNK